MRLLDSDILIDVARGYEPAKRWLNSLLETPSVPGIVEMELVTGCANKTQAAQVHKLVASYAIYWPMEADCKRALTNFTQFYFSHNLGFTDALIATAVGLSATLCTFNVKHFAVVPTFLIEQPYVRT